MRADDPRHGRKAGYEAGCRDLCCRRAQARYQNEWRMSGPRTIDVTGTRRRLEALQTLGWSLAEVSRMLGHERSYARKVITGSEGRVQRKTAATIAELYDRLCMSFATDPEERAQGWNASRERTRREAITKGYVGPLCWDDIDDPRERPKKFTAPTRIRSRKPDHEAFECPRCGVRRQVRVSGKTELCVDCKSVERKSA